MASSGSIAAVRGAVQADGNTATAIVAATARLLRALIDANDLVPERIVSALFTATPDLDADFPAHAARQLGWADVPLLGAREMGVAGAPERVVRVLLTVRPTVTRLRPEQQFVNDPNPSLCNDTRTVCVQNPVPQIQVREMESVLQVGSGQTVVLGGLMQDGAQRSRDQLPGADRAGDLGELFRFRDERAQKTELVVFLRPTVVGNPSLESDELKFFQRFLPTPEAPPQQQQPEKTGAAQ